MRKVTLAMQNLSYCGGCEVALADLGQGLLALLADKIDLIYAPLFMSSKDYGEVDILLMTGAARTEEDIEQIKKARERARYLVSFGSCASFGGIPGLANLYDKDHLLEVAFQEAPSIKKGGETKPYVDVPDLVERIRPIDEYVDVDFVLPGCPPPPPMIADFLTRVLATVRIEEE
jgi:F420-non-reducing hydrogenase small subunit